MYIAWVYPTGDIIYAYIIFYMMHIFEVHNIAYIFNIDN